MKLNLVIFGFLTNTILNEIYCIVPKYIPNVPVISKLRSLDDTRYRQYKYIQTPEIPVNDDRYEENYRFTDGVMNTANGLSKKLTKDLAAEDDSKKNRLPEVNLKDLINSKEVPNDESVEDFIDLSFEEIDSTEKLAKISQNMYVNKYYKKREIRAKRLATAAYDGRYKSQDINDVLKPITGNKSQVKKLDKNLTKSRRKRNSNIIEEENLVTTISIFKFTGRPRRLNEHLAFKNIHP